MQNSFMDYVDDKSATGRIEGYSTLQKCLLFLSFIMALLMVCFIFIEHFSLVTNMATGPLRLIMAMNI